MLEMKGKTGKVKNQTKSNRKQVKDNQYKREEAEKAQKFEQKNGR
jgi:hypothetical protein